MKPLRITTLITKKSGKTIDFYFKELNKLKLISTTEETELARRIRRGDEAALHELTKANLRFVVSVAKQYQNQGLSLLDLINEGNIGLMHAASRFDETRGFKFISYAVWWIRQSITAALNNHSRLIRLPQNKISTINKINKCYAMFEQRYERSPTLMELADELGIQEKDLTLILRSSQHVACIDEPLRRNGEACGNMYDVLADKDALQPDRWLFKEDLNDDIKRCLEALTTREAFIINASFGLNGIQPMSDRDIGSFVELTQERVSQIRRIVISRLKGSLRAQALVKYLT